MGSLAKTAQVSRAFAELLKQAESDEHIRLKQALAEWFKANFEQGNSLESIPELSGIKPDVLLWSRQGQYLLLGDAKNASNETPANRETLIRIKNYMEVFAECCHINNAQRLSGGILAIATNSKEAATGWIYALNQLANLAGLTDGDGGLPNFQVAQHDAKTWVTWW